MNAVLPFRAWITHRLPFYLGGAYLSAPTPKGADELVLALRANTEKEPQTARVCGSFSFYK